MFIRLATDGGSRVGDLSSQLTSKIQKAEAIDIDHTLM